MTWLLWASGIVGGVGLLAAIGCRIWWTLDDWNEDLAQFGMVVSVVLSLIGALSWCICLAFSEQDAPETSYVRVYVDDSGCNVEEVGE